MIEIDLDPGMTIFERTFKFRGRIRWRKLLMRKSKMQLTICQEKQFQHSQIKRRRSHLKNPGPSFYSRAMTTWKSLETTPLPKRRLSSHSLSATLSKQIYPILSPHPSPPTRNKQSPTQTQSWQCISQPRQSTNNKPNSNSTKKSSPKLKQTQSCTYSSAHTCCTFPFPTQSSKR